MFPYEKARKGQKEAIGFIRKNLGKKIFLRAPTGFGKTIVALLAHSDAEKVIYAVRTRNEITPVIRELRRIGEGFSFIFSAAKMCPLMKGKGSELNDFWLGCKILRSRGMCPYFNKLQKVSSEELRKIINDAATNDPHLLAKTITKKMGVCPFFALKMLSSESRFAVVTYPYVFRDEVYETAFDPELKPITHLILDEAHTLFNPQLIIGEEINRINIFRALQECRSHRVAEAVVKYLESIDEVLQGIRSRLLKRIPKDAIYSGLETLMMLEDAALQIKLRKMKEGGPQELLRRTAELTKILRFIKYVAREDFNVYGQVSPYEEKVIKALTPRMSYIHSSINQYAGALMMSGTLPPEEIVKAVLFPESVYVDVREDFGFTFPEYNTYYAVYTSLTSRYVKRVEDTYKGYSSIIRSLINALSEGVSLVVYPSYSFLKKVHEYLYLPGTFQVVEGVNTTTGWIDELRKRKKGVIHAVSGGKITEGIEVIDEEGKSLIKLVVVCGVPYPMPDDYIKDLRKWLRKNVGETMAKEFVMNVQAGIKVAQAIGRAIRSEDDRAFIVLADHRFMSRRLMSALGIRYDKVTGDIEELVNDFTSFQKNLL